MYQVQAIYVIAMATLATVSKNIRSHLLETEHNNLHCIPKPFKTTGEPERPLVLGFPATLISRCFIGTAKHMARLTRCV